MAKLIIDGNYNLYRAFHMNKDLKSSTGEPTGAIFIFLKMLWKLKKKGDLIVVFDGGRPSFRTDLFPDYKKRPEKVDSDEQREKDDILNFTKNNLLKMIPKLGIPTIMIPENEGDDVICKLGEHLSSQGNHVTLVSDDSDYYHFITKGCVVYRSMKDEVIDRKSFLEKFGFEVDYYLLYLAIIGTHNGVPGIKGIGPATATKIINKLSSHTYEALLEFCKSDHKLAPKVLENINIVERNMLLIDPDELPLSNAEVIMAYEESLRRAVIDYDYIFSKFQRYEFNSMGAWLAEISK